MAEEQPVNTVPTIPAQASKIPLGLRIFQFIILLQAALIAFNAIIAYTFNADDVAQIGIPKGMIVLIATFQLIIVAGMLVIVWAMNKRFPWSYYVSLGVLVLNLVANYASQKSTLQFITTVVLIILISPQRSYFRAMQKQQLIIRNNS